jgi:hypothetical protein
VFAWSLESARPPSAPGGSCCLRQCLLAALPAACCLPHATRHTPHATQPRHTPHASHTHTTCVSYAQCTMHKYALARQLALGYFAFAYPSLCPLLPGPRPTVFSRYKGGASGPCGCRSRCLSPNPCDSICTTNYQTALCALSPKLQEKGRGQKEQAKARGLLRYADGATRTRTAACAATKISGSEQCTEMHRCLGGCLDGCLDGWVPWLVGALAGGCLGWWVPWLVGALAGGCLGWWVPWLVGALAGGCLG